MNHPTWETAVKVYIDCLENSEASEEAQDGARSEIMRLARLMDKFNSENSKIV